MKALVTIVSIILLSYSTTWANTQHHEVHACQAQVGKKIYRCSLGRTGVTIAKQEGDGATPVGTFPLRKIFYRPDKFKKENLTTHLPLEALTKNKGWCDDPQSPFYNKEVKLPFAQSHENLWREDAVYDLIIVVGYNDKPTVKNKGSAIFIHVAREGYPGTAGCIAFEKNDLLAILPMLGPKSTVTIKPSGEVVFQG